ncbi:MAG: amidohydrolase family protein, partial [Ignavibacteriales bacterium]|nr:amidohydrolase family protein [Ignavibacteriales bacterium]
SWMINRIGKNRMKYAYAFRSLLENGINLCFGTDWPVVNLNPLETVYTAITRHTSDGMNPDGLFPEEKLTIEESLRAYTAAAAYASFDEKIKGSLEKGKLADFIILDHDLLKAEPDQIKSTKILMTVVGGKIKFQR